LIEKTPKEQELEKKVQFLEEQIKVLQSVSELKERVTVLEREVNHLKIESGSRSVTDLSNVQEELKRSLFLTTKTGNPIFTPSQTGKRIFPPSRDILQNESDDIIDFNLDE
jgi:hypothetical protein